MAKSKKKPAKSKSSAAAKISKKIVDVDFDDETQVLRAVAAHLDEDPDDLEIEAWPHAFTNVTVYEVTLGRMEYAVYKDEDEAHDEALARVKQDLEHEPSIFDPDFIESHINTDKLKDVVRQSEMESNYWDEEARDAKSFWQSADSFIDISKWKIEEPGEDDETVWVEGMDLPDDVPSDAIEEVKEAQAEDRAKDPMDYFRDIYGDDAAKHAIEAAGIDYDAAAEDAVNTDGWAHFMSTYDGNYDQLPSGIIVFRTN